MLVIQLLHHAGHTIILASLVHKPNQTQLFSTVRMSTTYTPVPESTFSCPHALAMLSQNDTQLFEHTTLRGMIEVLAPPTGPVPQLEHALTSKYIIIHTYCSSP